MGAVSYLNTKPLVYGFEQGMMKESVDLVIDYPSKIASMLLKNEIDIGLVPVAVIPEMNEHHIISDYCIGASAPVASVCLFSDVPVHQITHILVDYQSRTSASLLRILATYYWRISPIFIDTKEGYLQSIRGTTAGLVIGDRALKQRLQSSYVYDLAQEWQHMTGQSFLFAAWVSNKELPPDFIKRFNEATRKGLDYVDQIVANNPFEEYDLHTYYRKNIDFILDTGKQEAMKLFFHYLSKERKGSG